jgi:hypothetical protein
MENRDAPSLKSLEGEVPDEWVGGMWKDVEGRISGRRPSRNAWLVPTLAAASVALLVSSLWSLGALHASRGREALLLNELRAQEARLALPAEASPPSRLGRTRDAAIRAGWVRSLEGRRSVPVDEFLEILAALPPGTVLLDEGRVRAVLEARLVPAAWRRVLDGLDTEGPLRAGDLLNALRLMDLPSGATVPAGRLLDLLT